MTPGTLKKRRKNLKLSQFALANAIGISRHRITFYECGYIDRLSKEETVLIETELQRREIEHVANQEK